MRRILKIRYHFNNTRCMYYSFAIRNIFKNIASISKVDTVIQLLYTCRSISREIVNLLDGFGVKSWKQRRLRRQYLSKVHLYLQSMILSISYEKLLIHSFIETVRIEIYMPRILIGRNLRKIMRMPDSKSIIISYGLCIFSAMFPTSYPAE